MNIKSKNQIKLMYPASAWNARWREVLPSGNGKFGASVYGSVYDETILLNHGDLWWKIATPELPDISDRLPEVRRLLLEGHAKEADRILADALEEKNYNAKMGTILPLGDLKIIMPGKSGFEDYSRTLNMETGEIHVNWHDGETYYSRSLFVSRADDLVVCEIKADGCDLINAIIYLELHDIIDIPKYAANKQLSSYLPQFPESRAEGEYFFYAAQNDDSLDFGAVARIVTDKGKIEAVDGTLKITNASRVTICLIPFVKDDRNTVWKTLKTRLSNINMNYAELLKSHAKLHGELFKKMDIELYAKEHEKSNEELLLEAYKGEAPMALIEKMWSYGRYLLVSGSHEGSNPCCLYGLWCGEYEAKWALNMANENLQMIYWQAFSGNMPDLLLAVFDYYDGMMEDFRINAKRLYGCRGIYIPATTIPGSGLMKLKSPHIIHWTGAAGWIAQFYYDYYLYTSDINFLKNRALPFLKETALFYEDFFFIGEDGYYISCPSNSPENTPGNYWDGSGMGAVMETTINATMDFAIAKEVLTHLIQGAKTTGMYMDEVHKWDGMLKKIPPYQINEDGAVKEWMHPYFKDNYHHRHQSHIYPVFPGTEITKGSDSALYEAFVIAIKKRLIIGLKEQTGWSLAHMSNIYARMREGNLALECLNLMSRSCILNNFFTLHNDWRNMGIGVQMKEPPFQIDANMGWSAAIQEMLLFSVPGIICILPALPEKWRRGMAKSMLARGGIEVSMEWDSDIKKLNLKLLSRSKDQVVDIILPDFITDCNIKKLKLEKDQEKRIEFKE